MKAFILPLFLFLTVAVSAQGRRVIVDGTNLRADASVNAKVIKPLKRDDKLSIVKRSGNWLLVKSGNDTGWLRIDMIELKRTLENGRKITTRRSTDKSRLGRSTYPFGNTKDDIPISHSELIPSPSVDEKILNRVKIELPDGGRNVIFRGILNREARRLPKPRYPAAARAAGARGWVKVKVLIDENGEVTSATAVRGNRLLRAAAASAALKAKFYPTVLNGNQGKVSGFIMYKFVP
jgi:TonB family protein